MLQLRQADTHDTLSVDLTSMLYTAALHVVVVTFASLVMAMMLAIDHTGRWTVSVAAVTTFSGGLRVALSFAYRQRTRRKGITVSEARWWAFNYGVGAVLLGVCQAAMTWEAFLHGTTDETLTVVAICMAYTSGLAGRVAVYPQIGLATGAVVLGSLSLAFISLGTPQSVITGLMIPLYYVTLVKTLSQAHASFVHQVTTDREIRHMAHHDLLTDLPNRRMFDAQTQAALADANKAGTMAVLFLDLDRFKAVNDTFGHKMGDGLLVEVGRRLRACVREGDVLARFGGDEFAALQARCRGRQDAEALAERITTALRGPYPIDGQVLEIGVSIGLALYPEDGEDAETLLKNADVALYHAKDAGRGQACSFDPSMIQLSKVAGVKTA